MPRLSASLTFLFTEVEFLDRFDAAARAGFRSVEFMFPYAFRPEELQSCLRDSTLRLDLFNLPAGDFAAGERGVAALPERRDEFRSGVAMAIEYARALGTTKLNCLAGLRDEGGSWDEQYDCLVDNLRWAAREIGGNGLTLHVEPLCQSEVPGFFLDGVPLAERLLDDVGSLHLRLAFDVYHVQRAQGDVVTTMRRLIDRIGHVQVADSPGRGEPGSGELNFGYILGELDRLDYGGRVGLEYRPTRPTTESLGWIKEHGWHVGD